jgi:hypothetical protein
MRGTESKHRVSSSQNTLLALALAANSLAFLDACLGEQVQNRVLRLLMGARQSKAPLAHATIMTCRFEKDSDAEHILGG